jgi:Zn-finger nucleic acid-binding protein
MCPSCRGVWLVRGELEKILEGGRQAVGDERQARERFDREVDSFHRDPDAWKRSHQYDAAQKRYRYDDAQKRYRYDDDDYYRHKKRKKGFDIFDIFD